MDRRKALEDIGDKYGLLAVYLFGSRADDGLRHLRGESVNPEGSDLDIGIVFTQSGPGVIQLGSIQVELSDVFSPLTIDVVPLHKVDPLFQFRAIDGHRNSGRHQNDRRHQVAPFGWCGLQPGLGFFWGLVEICRV